LRGDLIILLSFLVLSTLLAVEASDLDEPLVLVYSGSMVEWASAICEILNEDDRITGECLVVPDRDLLSTMLFLPRVQGLILAPVAARDIKGVGDLAKDFFDQGGACVGFSPCTDIRSEVELASSVFPFFCNKSTGSERVGNRLVNTYVAREIEGEVADGLPTAFGLVSGGYLFATSPGGDVIEILPDEGTRRVFWEEEKTGAPLVIGYERPGTGRSVGFSGCRINEVSRSNTYFGALVDQEEFTTLLGNTIAWALGGSDRYSDLEDSWQSILQSEENRRAETVARATDAREDERTRRNLGLLGVWVLAGLACAISLWKFTFVRG
jgi:hypothetical protein